MGLLEGLVQTGLTAIGVDEDAAEKIADVVDLGANIVAQNYAGAASDLIDLAGKEDEVPWLCAILDMAGGDPTAGALGLGGTGQTALGQVLGQDGGGAQAGLGLLASILGADQAAQGTPGAAFGFDLDPRLQEAGLLFAQRMGWLPVAA